MALSAVKKEVRKLGVVGGGEEKGAKREFARGPSKALLIV